MRSPGRVRGALGPEIPRGFSLGRLRQAPHPLCPPRPPAQAPSPGLPLTPSSTSCPRTCRWQRGGRGDRARWPQSQAADRGVGAGVAEALPPEGPLRPLPLARASASGPRWSLSLEGPIPEQTAVPLVPLPLCGPTLGAPRLGPPATHRVSQHSAKVSGVDQGPGPPRGLGANRSQGSPGPRTTPTGKAAEPCGDALSSEAGEPGPGSPVGWGIVPYPIRFRV